MTGSLYKANTPAYTPDMARKPYNFRFDEGLMERIDAQGSKENRTRTNLIERVMLVYLEDPRVRELVREFERDLPNPTS